jgi:hypothetical protein
MFRESQDERDALWNTDNAAIQIVNGEVRLRLAALPLGEMY